MNDTSNKLQYSISDYGWNWYNILSNILSLIPTYQFMKDNNYYDAIIVLGTGVSSFFYHFNNNIPDVNSDQFFHKNAIQMTDSIMSYILILQITTYLAFYKNYYIRTVILFSYLPFGFYTIYSNEIYNIIFLIIIISILVIIIITNCYKNNYTKYQVLLFLIGLSMSGIEILMYVHLQNYNYNTYHSIHHTMAFLSISFYHYIPINNIFNKNKQFKKIDKLHINIHDIDCTSPILPSPIRNRKDNIQLRIHYDIKSPSPRP
jgi:hypothetical protein